MSYKKKIFDVIPPKKEKREQFLIEFKKDKLASSKKRFRVFICFFVILLVIFASCYFFVKPTAVVKIWPKTKNLTLKTTITATTQKNQSDFSQKVIPAFLLEVEKTISQEFTASVTTTEERARGVIRVYNKYYKPITLIKGTRFLPSDSDIKFLSQKRITIPAGGFTDVEVIAAAPGEEYNIQPCAFVIPNLRKFSPPRLYYDITGKSFAPMVGGRVSEIHKVSASDIENAKTVLKKRAFKEAKRALKEKTPKDTILLEDTIEQEVLDFIPLAKVGQEIENFVVQMKIRAKALGIKKSHLNNFAKEYVNSKLPQKTALYLESLNTNVKEERVDLEEETVELKVAISGLVYSSFNEDALKRMILGKDGIIAAQDIRANFPEVAKVEIKIKPFWRRKIPQKLEDIEVKINF